MKKELYNKLKYLLSKRRRFLEICNELGLSNHEVIMLIDILKKDGINTHYLEEEIRHNISPSPISEPFYVDNEKEHIRILLKGDSHYCNRCDRTDIGRNLSILAYEKKVDYVLDCGDLDEGPFKYVESGRYLRCEDYNSHLDYLEENVPLFEVPHFIVSGNHDDLWYEKEGKEIIKDLSDRRRDITYLGINRRDIMIGNLKIRLMHGNCSEDGRRTSNKNYLSNMIDGDVHMVHLGHLHNSFNTVYNGVHIFRTGALINATPYIKSKGHAIDRSVYLVDIDFDDNGKVKRIRKTINRFY